MTKISITSDLVNGEITVSVNRKFMLSDMLCDRITELDRILIDIVIRKCFVEVRHPPNAVGMTVNFIADGNKISVAVLSWIDGCDRSIEFAIQNRKTTVTIPWI